MAKIGDFDIRFQGADARLLALGRIAFALFLYLRYLSSVVLSHVSSFKIQVSGVGQVCCRWANRIALFFILAIFILSSADAHFRFQAGNYPTFLPAWKAVLSAAMVARDKVSGQFSENIKQGECDSPQRQLPKSIDCSPTTPSNKYLITSLFRQQTNLSILKLHSHPSPLLSYSWLFLELLWLRLFVIL